MDPQKPQENPETKAAPTAPDQSQPAAADADALGKPTDPNAPTEQSTPGQPDAKPPKQVKPIKKLLRKVNLYLLLFVLVLVIAGVIGAVSYLNNKKATEQPSIASQGLTTDALSKLASSDISVGKSGQTLTIQGNAIITGQVLIRSDLNVAGTIRVGGDVQLSTLTVATTANLPTTQISSLQVAQNTIMQGSVTLQKDLSVAGTSSFSAPATFSQITVSKLIVSGNGALEIPNHVTFSGPSPARSINPGPLGAGGTASINGSDTSGTINANTGSGTAAGCFINVTFAKAYAGAPHVIISPVGSAAGQMDYYVNRSATGFSVCTANAAPSGQAFSFDYFVTS